MSRLKLDNVTFSYSKNKILNQLNLEICNSEIVCLIGESGTGKTTLLRIIAGLEVQDHGTILLDDEIISNDSYNLETHNRNIGLVLQERALFPHLNVFENVTFGMRSSTKTKNLRCDELLDLFKISRPNDFNINAAITNFDGETEYFESGVINQQNSLVSKNDKKKIKIKAYKLNTLLDDFNIKYYEISNGFSKYKESDPIIIRIIIEKKKNI